MYDRRESDNSRGLFREQHYVSSACFIHGQADGLLAVRLIKYFPAVFCRPTMTSLMIFSGSSLRGLSAGKNRQVAQPARHFSHHGTFGAVFFLRRNRRA